MKKILIPFDFTEAAVNAFDYAVEFASKNPVISLYLLNTQSEEDKLEETEQKLNDFISRYKKPPGLEIQVVMHSGDWIDSTLSYYEKLGVDLVIVGTRGADASEEGIVTQTSKFVLKLDVPVLIVPQKVKFFRLETIILALGREKIEDKDALNTLLDVSRRFSAKVHVLTVEQDDSEMGYSENHEDNENILQYFLELFYSHHSFAENEDIEEGINQYLDATNADMLAILPNTHLESEKASKGELTRILTLHAQKPLLILD